MPDGYSLCFAVKENPFGDAAASSAHGRHSSVKPVTDMPVAVANVESSTPAGDSQPQPDANTAGSSTPACVNAVR